MAQFHETGYGRRFFEHELPELNRNIKRVADALEKIVEKPLIKSQPLFNVEETSIATGLNKSIIEFMNKCFEKQETKETLVNQDNISILKSIKLTDIFSVRITNSLLYCRNPKHNLYQLLISTERELMATKNFGAKCLHEITEYLSARNLELNMTEEELQSVSLSGF